MTRLPVLDAGAVTDRRGRPLRDLRISVTDRCNFRCPHCMPREIFGPDFTFLPRSEILSFEEIVRVVAAGRRLGVTKVRLTGGEPLLRRDLPDLVAMLAAFGPGGASDDGHGPLDLALTTNGSLLPKLADPLAEAGLCRVTVSLDSLDPEVFAAMNDTRVPVARVLEGIEAAGAAGLSPVKVNAVVRRGMNDHTLLDLARHFHGSGHVLRFIEYMDVGETNGWRLDEMVPGAEIVAAIDAELPLEPIEPAYPGEVARRWRYRDGGGEIGVITSVTRPFCGDCTRARLSAEGKVYTCLFATEGTDLRAVLRDERAEAGALDDVLRGLWTRRDDRYSEQRGEATGDQETARDGELPGETRDETRDDARSDRGRRIEMSYIGG